MKRFKKLICKLFGCKDKFDPDLKTGVLIKCERCNQVVAWLNPL